MTEAITRALADLLEALGDVPVGTVLGYAQRDPEPSEAMFVLNEAFQRLCRRYAEAGTEPSAEEFAEVWALPVRMALEALGPRGRWAVAHMVYETRIPWPPGGFELWQPVAALAAAIGAHP